MDDAKVFKILDLDDIEKTFSAYQRQQVLRTMQFFSPTHQMLASIAREGRGVDWVGGMGGRGLSWLAFSKKKSPVLQLLISQAQLEKREGERSDNL